jgi:hypothetical protein
MEITRWRPPRIGNENDAWNIRLGELEAILKRMPELTPEMCAAIIAAVFQRVRDKRR